MQDEQAAAAINAVGGPADAWLAELDDFESLVRLHQRRVYRVLLGMVRDADAAEVLTQECFLRAYQKRDSFRGETSAGAWLLKIAINLARDHRRSRLREYWRRLFSASEHAADIEESLPDSQPSPERALLAREKVASVWAAAERLSPQQRAIFILRFVDEMSLEEIAAVTSLKVGTVKAHLFRAVGSVREQVCKGQKHG